MRLRSVATAATQFILFYLAINIRQNEAITACTVVQAVVKATSQSNGKGQIWPPGAPKPWTDFDETWNI